MKVPKPLSKHQQTERRGVCCKRGASKISLEPISYHSDAGDSEQSRIIHISSQRIFSVPIPSFQSRFIK